MFLSCFLSFNCLQLFILFKHNRSCVYHYQIRVSSATHDNSVFHFFIFCFLILIKLRPILRELRSPSFRRRHAYFDFQLVKRIVGNGSLQKSVGGKCRSLQVAVHECVRRTTIRLNVGRWFGEPHSSWGKLYISILL